MPIPRYAAKTDKNHVEIKEAYERLGFTVADASKAGGGFPDLVVGKFDRSWLVEIKYGRKKPNQLQIDFKKNWKGDYRIVRTLEDVAAHAAEAVSFAQD